MITLPVRRFTQKYAIYVYVFYSGKDILKMAAGDYSTGKEKLITLTVFTLPVLAEVWIFR